MQSHLQNSDVFAAGGNRWGISGDMRLRSSRGLPGCCCRCRFRINDSGIGGGSGGSGWHRTLPRQVSNSTFANSYTGITSATQTQSFGGSVTGANFYAAATSSDGTALIVAQPHQYIGECEQTHPHDVFHFANQ